MKKFFGALLGCWLMAATALAGGTVGVEPIKNLAGEEGAAATQHLQDELIAAIQSSGSYGVKNGATSNPYSLAITVSEVKAYKSQEDKAKVLPLMRRSLGNDPEATPEEVQAAKEALKEIAENPFGEKITAEARFLDNATGEAVFTQTFTGEGMGKTADEAAYNADKELAKEIVKAMVAVASPEEDSEDIAAEPAAELTAPVDTSPVATGSVASLRALVGDMAGNTLYLDKGRAAGLKVGMTVGIYRISGDVVIGGKVLGKKELAIGEAKVTEVYEEYTVCEVTTKTADITVGDVVKNLQR
ncbi:MAG: hypothetical protein IJ849_11030 [Selenomonadaceae bacterium]|nr:hypothetical protein [Selenomonadaceae bacterium]